MIGLIVNAVADILEFTAKLLRQAQRDFAAAKIRAEKSRRIP